MADIKLIRKETDFTTLSMDLVPWDLEIQGNPYDIYRISGYCHTIGGQYGNNDFWCCPIGEKPCYDNLIEFDGNAPTWGVEYKQSNHTKCKWNETSVRKSGSCTITRNGKPFHEFGARDMDYGLAKAQVMLVEIHEHIIPFHFRNWEKDIVGTKVYFREQPAIIESLLNWGGDEICVMIVPDKEHIDCFKKPSYLLNEDNDGYDEYEHEYKDRVKDDIFSRSISWFRE